MIPSNMALMLLGSGKDINFFFFWEKKNRACYSFKLFKIYRFLRTEDNRGRVAWNLTLDVTAYVGNSFQLNSLF